MKNDEIFLHGIKRSPEYKEAVKCVKEQFSSSGPRLVLVTGLCEGATDAFFVSLREDAGSKTLLLILPDERACAYYEQLFTSLGVKTFLYPYKDFIFYDITSSREFERKRISALYALLEDEAEVIITTPDAATQFTIPKKFLSESSFTILPDNEYGLADLERSLTLAGYLRHDPVDGAGQFSVRGGILDIFSTAESEPVRIEFFGDEIDSMSYFDPLTQRRTEIAERYTVLPAREILCTDEVREQVRAKIKKQLSTKKVKENEHATSLLEGELAAAEEDGEINFLDKYISAIYPEGETLLDHIEKNALVVLHEYTAAHGTIQAYQTRMTEEAKNMASLGLIDPKIAKYNISDDIFDQKCDEHVCVTVNSFLSNIGNRTLSGLFSFKTRHIRDYGRAVNILREELENYIKLGFETVVLTENEKSEENLRALLSEEKIKTAQSAPKKAAVFVCHGARRLGYELPDSSLAFLSIRSDAEDYRAGGIIRSSRRKKRKDAGERIMSYADITEGDFVVHESHGIGKYLGITSMTLDGVTRDFLKIKYAGTDNLYIPCDNLQSLSKYIGTGSDDGNVRLSKLGGGEWEKAKQRASKAAKDMAKELIALYAERLRKPGFAFPPDDEMQMQFESEFVFDETDGQLDAIEDVKKDMMSPHPMDRLLCGDVGFGKTEVAIRAAFKAAMAGKQTAILAPTTLLCMQHYETLVSRMRAYPINCAMVSRMVPAKKQKEILRALKRGEIDIIVGTHRLISSDIEFSDLGLLIVDEEQRFGVAQKEKLKQVAKNADVLTLTATPIPRTLNMAMSGIRDMSILEEAPGDRLPVQTYVMEYDDAVIEEAIRRELSRGGQVFYLFNRVDGIERRARELSESFPSARISVAHGRMDKDELSDLWQKLVTGNIDIMVCTTIIETGVDIPNANTLIIENADRMGLSQLHQIRGRVGRSPRRAYAYFTYRRGKSLSEESAKRLSAIREYTEFGSGFKVALRDLEIRGAGNILGAEQHGHIASVGYDMYMKILNEAILKEGGKLPEKKPECTVDIKVSAFIPDRYIKEAGQRIDAYRKISLIETDADLSDVTDELIDRYGEPPAAVIALLRISLIRALGEKHGFTKIECREDNVLIRGGKINFVAWSVVASESAFRGKILINASAHPYISFKPKKDDDIPLAVLSVIRAYEKAKEETENED